MRNDLDCSISVADVDAQNYRNKDLERCQQLRSFLFTSYYVSCGLLFAYFDSILCRYRARHGCSILLGVFLHDMALCEPGRAAGRCIGWQRQLATICTVQLADDAMCEGKGGGGGEDLVVVLSNISSDVVGEGLALKRALLKLPAVQQVWR